jgi:hypothetical protein
MKFTPAIAAMIIGFTAAAPAPQEFQLVARDPRTETGLWNAAVSWGGAIPQVVKFVKGLGDKNKRDLEALDDIDFSGLSERDLQLVARDPRTATGLWNPAVSWAGALPQVVKLVRSFTDKNKRDLEALENGDFSSLSERDLQDLDSLYELSKRDPAYWTVHRGTPGSFNPFGNPRLSERDLQDLDSVYELSKRDPAGWASALKYLGRGLTAASFVPGIVNAFREPAPKRDLNALNDIDFSGLSERDLQDLDSFYELSKRDPAGWASALKYLGRGLTAASFVPGVVNAVNEPAPKV